MQLGARKLGKRRRSGQVDRPDDLRSRFPFLSLFFGQTMARYPSTGVSLRIATAGFAVLATAAGSASTDPWGLFLDRRDASASGRRYVLVHQAKGTGIRFQLCECGPGRLPARSATTRDVLAGTAEPLDVAFGDRVLAAGRIKRLPSDVYVFDKPGGFVLFDTYRRLGKGNVVTYVNDAGNVAFSKTVKDLYGGVPVGAVRSGFSVGWSRGWFVDERRRSIVVVATGNEFREIAIQDGSTTEPSFLTMLGWLQHGTDATRELMFGVILERPIEDLKLACSTVIGIAHDPKQPMGLRLRAAIVLSRAGDPATFEKLFLSSVENDMPLSAREFAAAHLPEVLGERSVPVLRKLLRDPERSVRRASQNGWVGLGESAVPMLCAMLLDKEESALFRHGAAAALWRLKSQASVDPLMQAARGADAFVANMALNAAIHIRAPKLESHLLQMLLAGSTQDTRVALYFAKWPSRAALPALRVARERPGLDPFGLLFFDDAIARCEALSPKSAASRPSED